MNPELKDWARQDADLNNLNENEDFKDGGINSKRYKYWALGSTIGITVSLGYAAITNSRPIQKQYQFNSDWPNKQADVWKFK